MFRTRFFVQAARKGKHDPFGDDLDGCGQVHVKWPEITFGITWRLAKQRMEALACHSKSTMEFKELKIESEGSIWFNVN